MNSRKDQVIAAIVCAAVLGAYAMLIARPQSRAVASVREQAQRLTADIELRQAVARGTAVLERDMQAVRERLAGVGEQLPSSMRLGELIGQLSAASEAWNLRGTDLIPARSYEVDRILVLPIEVTFQCDFPSLFGFLKEVESLPRIVRVSNLRMQREGDEPAAIACELTLQVFSEIHEGP